MCWEVRSKQTLKLGKYISKGYVQWTDLYEIQLNVPEGCEWLTALSVGKIDSCTGKPVWVLLSKGGWHEYGQTHTQKYNWQLFFKKGLVCFLEEENICQHLAVVWFSWGLVMIHLCALTHLLKTTLNIFSDTKCMRALHCGMLYVREIVYLFIQFITPAFQAPNGELKAGYDLITYYMP